MYWALFPSWAGTLTSLIVVLVLNLLLIDLHFDAVSVLNAFLLIIFVPITTVRPDNINYIVNNIMASQMYYYLFFLPKCDPLNVTSHLRVKIFYEQLPQLWSFTNLNLNTFVALTFVTPESINCRSGWMQTLDSGVTILHSAYTRSNPAASF